MSTQQELYTLKINFKGAIKPITWYAHTPVSAAKIDSLRSFGITSDFERYRLGLCQDVMHLEDKKPLLDALGEFGIAPTDKETVIELFAYDQRDHIDDHVPSKSKGASALVQETTDKLAHSHQEVQHTPSPAISAGKVADLKSQLTGCGGEQSPSPSKRDTTTGVSVSQLKAKFQA